MQNLNSLKRLKALFRELFQLDTADLEGDFEAKRRDAPGLPQAGGYSHYLPFPDRRRPKTTFRKKEVRPADRLPGLRAKHPAQSLAQSAGQQGPDCGMEGPLCPSAIASRIIRETMEAGLVKPYETPMSKKYAKYVPFWS